MLNAEQVEQVIEFVYLRGNTIKENGKCGVDIQKRKYRTILLPLPKEVMFLVRSVCLSVRVITEKVVNGF